MAPTTAAHSLAGRRDIVPRARRLKRFARAAGWLLSFVIMLLVWQTALFLALSSGVLQFGAYGCIHIIGCLALAAWPVWRLRGSAVDERNSTALQIVAWSAFAGPFGALVATALTFPAALTPSRISVDGDDELTTDCLEIQRVERVHIALLDRRLRIEGASGIRPLIDVVAEGSRSEKLEALRVVYRKYEAGLSTVLKRAVQDQDTSVRVLAATVIAKLNTTYSRSISSRQVEAGANPELARHWQTLGEARLAYAQSGLLESGRARAQVEFAICDLSRAAELDPDGEATSKLLGSARRQLIREMTF